MLSKPISFRRTWTKTLTILLFWGGGGVVSLKSDSELRGFFLADFFHNLGLFKLFPPVMGGILVFSKAI